MGGPTLEIMRMALYVFTPVATFYYFNLPSYYESTVKTKFVSYVVCYYSAIHLHSDPSCVTHCSQSQPVEIARTLAHILTHLNHEAHHKAFRMKCSPMHIM